MAEPMLDPDKVAFKSMTAEPGHLDLTATDEPGNGVILGMAEAMAQLLGDATNYVECEVRPNAGSDLRSMTMTVRYRSRPTPHELRQQAEKERDEALGEVARLTAENTRLRAVAEWADRALEALGEDSDSDLSESFIARGITTILAWQEGE